MENKRSEFCTFSFLSRMCEICFRGGNGSIQINFSKASRIFLKYMACLNQKVIVIRRLEVMI